MRFLGILLFALCVTVSLANASEPQKLSSAEQVVADVVKARMEAAATRDLTTWSRYVEEDCIFSGDNGTIQTKAQMLAYYKKVPAEYDRALDPRDFVVHLYGNTAVVNLRATDHEPSGDVDVVTEQRRTETFIKRTGAWLAIAIQWTAVPINHRKPVANDGRSYKDFVGQYRTRPKDDIEIISIKDGKLWSQTGNDGDWCEPAGGDSFFYQNDLGTFTFNRDSRGQVTGYTYRHFDGQEIRSQKVQ